MRDPAFIEQILKEGQRAVDKVRGKLSDLSREQINWKPTPHAWSVGQCLDHLAISHAHYFPDLRTIAAGTYTMPFWAKYSPLTSAFGKAMKAQLKEEVGRKMIAPKKITPIVSPKEPSFIDLYLESLQRFLQFIADTKDVDIDKTVIVSPTLAIVTYNLRDAYQFLVQHEHRHINQAIRVTENQQFPKK